MGLVFNYRFDPYPMIYIYIYFSSYKVGDQNSSPLPNFRIPCGPQIKTISQPWFELSLLASMETLWMGEAQPLIHSLLECWRTHLATRNTFFFISFFFKFV